MYASTRQDTKVAELSLVRSVFPAGGYVCVYMKIHMCEYIQTCNYMHACIHECMFFLISPQQNEAAPETPKP